MKHRYLAGMLAVVVASVVGCGRSAETENKQGTDGGHNELTHKEHPAPESLPDALAKIKEARTELGEGYAAGDVTEAHHAFDELTSTVKATKTLIDSANMERYDSQDAHAACDELSKLVGPLHPPHGEGATLDADAYDKVKDDIDAAITKLENAINKATEEEPAAE